MSEADSFEWLPALLVLQGLLGAIDTLLNHELIERLPMRREARGELALHAGREAVYAALFLGLGWFAWLGGFAAAIALLLAAEVTITVTDELTENRIRYLPPELSPGIDYSFFAIDPDGHAMQLYYYMEQIGWDGKPRPAHLRPRIDEANWPESVPAASDSFNGEVYLGPWS